MKLWHGALLALAVLAPAAHAQFGLYLTSCTSGQPLGMRFTFPTAYANMPDTVTFCLLNTTSSAQTLETLSVSSAGFTLTGASAPKSLPAGASVTFQVTLNAATPGYYSGALNVNGAPVLLGANLVLGAACQVEIGATNVYEPVATPVDFSSVPVGSNVVLYFQVVNPDPNDQDYLTVDSISVSGDFSAVQTLPSKTLLDPGEGNAASFAIQFSPTAAGTRTGTLSITSEGSKGSQAGQGTQQFALTGTGATSLSLFQTSCKTGLPIGAAFVFPTVYTNATDSMAFCLLNNTDQAQTVTAPSVTGAGFSTDATAPMTLPANGSAQFTVTFQDAAAGTYTGSLNAAGLSVALSATATLAPTPLVLYQTSCTSGQQAGAQFAFPTVYPNTVESAVFCILNTSNQTETVETLSVTSGFSILDATAPISLKAGVSVQFTVVFQGENAAGSYTGTLDAAGISVALTVIVAPALNPLTYEVELASGNYTQLTTPVNFGSVQVGLNTTLNFLAVNRTTATLTVDSIGVSAGDFALAGSSPGGESLAPGATAAFSIVFNPSVAGMRTGVLSVGSQPFTLTGAGVAAALPTPILSVTLCAAASAGCNAESAQQGAVAVAFEAAAETAGSGSVTLAFDALTRGELDPGVVFSNGGATVPFTFNPGDMAARFGGAASIAFQTGTTAGTLTVQAEIGNQRSQQVIAIAPAMIGIAAVTGSRQTSTTSPGVTVDVTAFDNTRSAGMLTFTFYDANGKPIPPGAINYQDAPAFSSYFATSTDGGQFALSAFFPVLNGAVSQVSAFTVALTNATGIATTARQSF